MKMLGLPSKVKLHGVMQDGEDFNGKIGVVDGFVFLKFSNV